MRRDRRPVAARVTLSRGPRDLRRSRGATMGGPRAQLAAAGVKERRIPLAAAGPMRLKELSPQELQLPELPPEGKTIYRGSRYPHAYPERRSKRI